MKENESIFKRLGPLFFGLWIVTTVMLVGLFLMGRMSFSSLEDGRRVVEVSASDKVLILTEMRELLFALNRMHGALAVGDQQAAADAAESVGMGMVESLAEREASLIAKLPIEMKKLGFSTHENFDDIAKKLRDNPGMDQRTISAEIKTLTDKCVACHAAYRIEATY
ncbi:hypothetical protein [Leptonema illini]|uniref:Cytochrome c class II n=1 Tax=Leptonema illini DSM 21528 TaxID=929563 RepID=H2CA93_9LEPT|nr:hypothetical protein [Leptonema illini]EHQ06251.1 hypothetical protein Lepil_1564 [Leptonema illini DSM 21528]